MAFFLVREIGLCTAVHVVLEEVTQRCVSLDLRTAHICMIPCLLSECVCWYSAGEMAFSFCFFVFQLKIVFKEASQSGVVSCM